jgi:inner membrane protein
MLAPTHSIVGVFLTLIILAVFGIQWSLHWTIIVCAILGAILPDIDHPKSVIGRIFKIISVPLERRYEHRTITHSLIGWAIASAIFALIITIPSFVIGYLSFDIWALVPRWLAAFSIGYLSHLILDMFNRRGSQMFWPDKSRDVIPKNPKLRPESGAKIEIAIFIVLMFLIILALPLSKYGLKSSLRWLLATPESAMEEIKNYKIHSYLEFDGIFNQTKLPIKGKAEILDVNKKLLVVLFSGIVYTIGDEYTADIIASNVRVKRTEQPIINDRIEFKNESREQLIRRIPAGALVSGVVHLPENMQVVIESAAPTFKVIEQIGGDLVLRFASRKQIVALKLTEAYDLEKRKDAAELLSLQSEAAKTNARIQEINAGDGLTELGRQALLSEEDKKKEALELSGLNSQLAELNVKIDEVKLRIQNRKFVFSGEVYLRR